MMSIVHTCTQGRIGLDMSVIHSATVFYGLVENEEESTETPFTKVYAKISGDEEWDEKLYDAVTKLQQKHQVEISRYEDFTTVEAFSLGTGSKGWSYETFDPSPFFMTYLFKERLQNFVTELREHYPMPYIDFDKTAWHIMAYSS